MESKSIKVIDEHSIDREASIICKFSMNDNDYVLYSIERDNDNDNLFTSKLLKNNDGTASMVNIDDSAEKAKVNEIVKDLVTYSIKNENDKVSDKVTLSNGTEVTISNVLFNKEQNINVAKTYVTTVKKSVTKVSEDFYKIEKKEEVSVAPVAEVVPEMPEVEPEIVKEEVPEEKELTNEEIMNSFVEPVKVEEPAVVVEKPTPEPTPEPVLPVEEAPKVEEPVVKEEVIPEVKVEAPVLEVEPVKATESTPVIPEVTPKPVQPVVEEPKVEEPVVKEEMVTSESVLPVTPVIPVTSAIPEPTVPVSEVPKPVEQVSTPEGPELVFDASKETNLNIALGEVTSDTSVKVEDASSLREFGQEEPVVTPTVQPGPEASATLEPETPAKTRRLFRSRGGFANSKFVTVIAILFFVAACVFLGYEIFHYFQLTK